MTRTRELDRSFHINDWRPTTGIQLRGPERSEALVSCNVPVGRHNVVQNAAIAFVTLYPLPAAMARRTMRGNASSVQSTSV
jgi:hypothetical protein